jgi:hypothetical protein
MADVTNDLGTRILLVSQLLSLFYGVLIS